MKKFLLIFALFSGFAFSGNAQGWFQEHPQWVNYVTFGWQGSGYEYMTVEGDTLLQGLPAVNLKRWFNMESGNDFVYYRQARQQGDTIWVWNHADNEFYIQYNFSLTVGDSVIGPLAWGGNQFRYYIDSVGAMLVDGHPLRFQQVHFYTADNRFHCEALAIEKIGFIRGGCVPNPSVFHYPMGTHLLVDEPNEGAVDGTDWLFCQYHNDGLNYDSITGCAGLTNQKEPIIDATFSIQPNPFHDVFSVVTKKDQAASYLRVFDAGGRLVLQTSPPFSHISTNGLGAGLYLLEVTLEGGSRQFYKAIKE